MLVPGGLIVFIADAGSLAANTLTQFKPLLIAVGIANVVLFRRRWSARLASWDADPSGAGRVQVMLSIAIWLAVPTVGRLIAYL